MPGSIQHTDGIVIASAMLNALRYDPIRKKLKRKDKVAK